jgi:hypothetical protein
MGMNVTGVVHGLQPPLVNAEFWIDVLDPAYYAVADGDGQTTAPHEADVDVGSGARPTAERCAHLGSL